MLRTRTRHLRALAALLAAALIIALPAAADTDRLPGVTPAMTEPDYWANRTPDVDVVLAGAAEIRSLNAGFLACEDCRMTDLERFYPSYDGEALKRQLLKRGMQTLSNYFDEGFFNADDEPVPYADMAEILEAIDGAEVSEHRRVLYGICVTLANVRAIPSDMIITDSAGDIDYDELQMSYIRVNEPVVIHAQTEDGSWLYCDSISVSGWVPSKDIAVCENRREWRRAWRIPEQDALVVTEGKLYLDEANVNAAASQRMLTMGTVLRRVPEEAYDPAVTNRALYQNYAVYMPVRNADGSYDTTIALIPRRAGVSEGYLPLTSRNVLNVAFSMLGDAYGWGGMLGVPDCSLYIRNIYKCFGLELPRNTTWQSAMPALRYDLSEMEARQKAELLDALEPGAILFFKGHEMLYLGRAFDRHYVLSSVSSIMAPGGEGRLRIRSVVINTLEDTKRANGKTWLQDLNLAVIPYRAEAEASLPQAG